MRSSETDEAVAASRATIDRVRGRAEPVAGRGRRRRRRDTLAGRSVAIAGMNALILITAVVIGYNHPLGLFGGLFVLLLMAATTLAIAFAPAAAEPVPSPDRLREAELTALPRQTGRWLAAQRPSLPAPAVTLVDRIGVRLDALEPQLAALDEKEPIAADLRQLIGEQLPEFVRGYAKVPAALRTVPRHGKTPDAQLTDGLQLIEQQIGEMSAQLAQGDLDSLATRGRFLEIKYRGDEG